MGTPTPAPQGEALCGLLAFLVFQKRFLDVLGPCSPGWGWHTPGTFAEASSLPSVPEGALLWPWGQADASMQDLRVAAIISNKGLVFTKVIADSLGGGVGPPVQRVPPPCQDSRIL